MRQRTLAIVLGLASIARVDTAVAESPVFVRDLNDGKASLRGFVDLHTHWMSHLGFGGHVVHGAPDDGVLMPKGQIYRQPGCNDDRDERANGIKEALGGCRATHHGHDLINNQCGNHIRRVVLDAMEGAGSKPHSEWNPKGFPQFASWPRYNDTQHQQMWVDWVRRAYDGGLRVIVALAVNSVALAVGVQGNTPNDDRFTGNQQIVELTRMVSKHSSWMEVALSSRDLRRIVGDDKLAVIIGTELDDLGNFAWTRAHGGRAPSERDVVAEVSRLHSMGVRYVFPVHVIDNLFGGTAIDEPEFPRAGRYHFGAWPNITCARRGDGITKRISSGGDLVKLVALGGAGGSFPTPNCPNGVGFVNSRGLQALGRTVLEALMARGVLIDIDHMSQQTVSDTIEYTKRYPLVSGHNGLRGRGPDVNENSRTVQQYEVIASRRGVVGVGWGGLSATSWLESVKRVLRAVPGSRVNLGSDINGLVVQPSSAGCSDACRHAISGFSAMRTGDKTWNYPRDGVAHMGLFPDFLRHVETLPGGQEVIERLYDGAEGFAQMWEMAEAVGRGGLPVDLMVAIL